MKKVFLVLVGLVFLSYTTYVSFAYWKSNSRDTAIAQQAEKHPLLAKRVFIENPSEQILDFYSLRVSLQEYLENLDMHYSLYFEYLPNGTSIDINEGKYFIAASLIKVVTVMELFQAAELGLIDLDATTYTVKEDLNPTYGELYGKGENYPITLREAARLALEFSDNTASRLINRHTLKIAESHPEIRYTPLDSLDVDFVKQDEKKIIKLTASSFSSVLKCLYYSCLLGFDYSNNILDHLTNSLSTGGLVDGIPEGIKVAHKFGEYYDNFQSDCGIVYVPDKPYILCIMLKAGTEEANIVTSEISRFVYNYVSNTSAY